jgi:hypothetical protein
VRRFVPLELCFTLSLVLVFSSVLSSTDMTMALAVDMPDAPATQDTITAGSGGGDEDQENDDQEDDPITQGTINLEEESRGDNDEDNSEQNNNDNNDDNEPTTEIKDTPNCPAGQESALFSTTCMPIQACGNNIAACCIGIDGPILSEANNRCANAPLADHPSTED